MQECLDFGLRHLRTLDQSLELGDLFTAGLQSKGLVKILEAVFFIDSSGSTGARQAATSRDSTTAVALRCRGQGTGEQHHAQEQTLDGRKRNSDPKHDPSLQTNQVYGSGAKAPVRKDHQ